MLSRLLSKPRQWFAAWLARRLPPVQSLRLQQRHIFIVPTRTGSVRWRIDSHAVGGN